MSMRKQLAGRPVTAQGKPDMLECVCVSDLARLKQSGHELVTWLGGR